MRSPTDLEITPKMPTESQEKNRFFYTDMVQQFAKFFLSSHTRNLQNRDKNKICVSLRERCRCAAISPLHIYYLKIPFTCVASSSCCVYHCSSPNHTSTRPFIKDFISACLPVFLRWHAQAVPGDRRSSVIFIVRTRRHGEWHDGLVFIIHKQKVVCQNFRHAIYISFDDEKSLKITWQ